MSQAVLRWFARVSGALLWVVPAAWYALLSIGFLGTLEYGAESGCGNPQFSLLLLAILSWPLLWAGSLVIYWVMRKGVSESVLREERPLRYAYLACPIFVAVFLATCVVLGVASSHWFPERYVDRYAGVSPPAAAPASRRP